MRPIKYCPKFCPWLETSRGEFNDYCVDKEKRTGKPCDACIDRKRKMTNQELYWWARINPKGEVKYEDGDDRTIWKDGTWSYDIFDKNKSDEPVDDCITIRSSKKGEWEEPLIGEDEEL